MQTCDTNKRGNESPSELSVEKCPVSGAEIQNTHRPIELIQVEDVEMCVPFCGGKTSDLTSDELYSEHLRIFCVTDQSKYLQGDEQHF